MRLPKHLNNAKRQSHCGSRDAIATSAPEGAWLVLWAGLRPLCSTRASFTAAFRVPGAGASRRIATAGELKATVIQLEIVEANFLLGHSTTPGSLAHHYAVLPQTGNVAKKLSGILFCQICRVKPRLPEVEDFHSPRSRALQQTT